MLCNNPLFRDYLTATTGRIVPDAATAAAEVRLACGVLSRRELDGNEQALAGGASCNGIICAAVRPMRLSTTTKK